MKTSIQPITKLTTLADAAGLVAGASRVALGGWGFSRRPMRIAMEWIARELRFDELYSMTGGMETDMVLAAGVVPRVRSFYLGMESLGMGPGLKAGAEVVEETETSMMLGLNAVVEGVSFLPLPKLHGQALSRVRPELKAIRCPYGGAEYWAIPPTPVDVAYIHGWRADPRGNVVLGGHKGADRLLALAARHVVVTCEELVDDIADMGQDADITELLVDKVVHIPGGARPGGCLPSYEPDWPKIMDYAGIECGAVSEWVRRNFLDLKT